MALGFGLLAAIGVGSARECRAAALPFQAKLTIDFVPEPTTLVLLGAGVAGLAAVGRSRRAHGAGCPALRYRAPP